MKGASREAMRPNPAAAPVPVPRTAVGYSSGPIAYSAPQAPRLKKLRAQPETMIIASVSARPKAVAATAEPARNTVSVQRRRSEERRVGKEWRERRGTERRNK